VKKEILMMLAVMIHAMADSLCASLLPVLEQANNDS